MFLFVTMRVVASKKTIFFSYWPIIYFSLLLFTGTETIERQKQKWKVEANGLLVTYIIHIVYFFSLCRLCFFFLIYFFLGMETSEKQTQMWEVETKGLLVT